MSIAEVKKFVESWIEDAKEDSVAVIDKPIQICGVTLPKEVVGMLKAHYFVECEERANQILQMLEDVERVPAQESTVATLSRPSPICIVNNKSTINGVDVDKDSLITVQIANTQGVRAWSIRCLTTDDLHVAKDISSGLSVDHYKKTATFTSPNTENGAAMIFESKVNGGIDFDGRNDESLTTRFGVFVLTDNGKLRVGAFDEAMEGSATFGWTAKLNACIRATSESFKKKHTITFDNCTFNGTLTESNAHKITEQAIGASIEQSESIVISNREFDM